METMAQDATSRVGRPVILGAVARAQLAHASALQAAEGVLDQNPFLLTTNQINLLVNETN